MKVIVAENHEEVSRLAADILEETVRANPCCTLGALIVRGTRNKGGKYRG